MRHVPLLLYNLVVCSIRLLRPGGIKSIAAENLILRQQLNVLKRAIKSIRTNIQEGHGTKEPGTNRKWVIKHVHVLSMIEDLSPRRIYATRKK